MVHQLSLSFYLLYIYIFTWHLAFADTKHSNLTCESHIHVSHTGLVGGPGHPMGCVVDVLCRACVCCHILPPRWTSNSLSLRARIFLGMAAVPRCPLKFAHGKGLFEGIRGTCSKTILRSLVSQSLHTCWHLA